MAVIKSIAAAAELTAIDSKKEKSWKARIDAARNETRAASDAAREVEFDEDDMEQPVAMSAEADEEGVSAEDAASTTVEPPAGLYYPMMFFGTDIRAFYARKEGRAGTRIVYLNGAAQLVKESYAEVKAAFGIAA